MIAACLHRGLGNFSCTDGTHFWQPIAHEIKRLLRDVGLCRGANDGGVGDVQSRSVRPAYFCRRSCRNATRLPGANTLEFRAAQIFCFCPTTNNNRRSPCPTSILPTGTHVPTSSHLLAHLPDRPVCPTCHVSPNIVCTTQRKPFAGGSAVKCGTSGSGVRRHGPSREGDAEVQGEADEVHGCLLRGEGQHRHRPDHPGRVLDSRAVQGALPCRVSLCRCLVVVVSLLPFFAFDRLQHVIHVSLVECLFECGYCCCTSVSHAVNYHCRCWPLLGR